MEAIVERIVEKCIQSELIEESQRDWMAYSLQRKFMNFGGFFILVCFGALVAPLPQTSVYKGYKRDKIEMRGDRAEMSDFPLYLNTVAGGLDRRDQTIGGFSFVVKIYAVPVVEIIG